jgi:electron transport complex protein RnfC
VRKIWDFHGGIHPPENKHQSLGNPIQRAGIPPQLVIPTSQHIGAPAEPVVTVGEIVLKGQLIAKADGYISVPKHAPTSGVITAIENRPIAHASGLSAPCVVIDTDGRDQWLEHTGVADFRTVDKPALLQLIRDAGVAGMGGAGFPSAVKLGLGNDANIETLIINGTECEPYITADDALMRERAAEIIAGAEILRYLVEPDTLLIGVEDNKPEGIAAMEKAASGTGMEVVVFPTKYPSGGEKQLIEVLTGKQVPSGQLPASIGVVCQNMGSAAAIHRAVVHGEPLISRITTVTGRAVAEPRNFEVLIGTPMRYLLQQAGYQAADNNRLIMGGPMMGFAVPDLDAPITKTTNCLLAPTEAELPTPPPAQACIRCGMCAEVCPATLLPQQLYWFAQGKEYEKLESHSLFDCIECGACSYACPSNIPLVQYYRASKAEIMQARRDHARSEHSRTRYEARQERLDREAAEKDAQRKARKAAAEQRAKAAAAGDGEADPIQAAIERAKAKKAAQAGATAGPVQSTDPAQAAIEKARAARAASSALAPEEKARQDLEKLRSRLTRSEKTLAESRDNGAQEKVIVALEATLLKLQDKINLAESALADESSTGNATASDPAQAAIERAQAKRAAAANAPQLSPREQLQQNRAAVEKRLASVREKLEQALAENTDTVDVIQASVEKLNAKLAQVDADLQNLEE